MNRDDPLSSVHSLAPSLDAAPFADVVRQTQPCDVVDALVVLKPEETLALLMTLEPQARAELFTHFPEAHQDSLLRTMAREAVVQWFEKMPAADRADLFNRLEEDA